MAEIDKLIEVMRRLRAPDGCPWDRAQTHETLKDCLLGEAAEYLDAVDAKDDSNMREELGDLLMEVVLNAVIAEERGAFTFDDVVREVTEKMIRRHPHVFSDQHADSVSDVLKLWESVKKEEKNSDAPVSVLARVPRNLPALARAAKIQKKAAKAGFDWPDSAGVRAKLDEEVREVAEALDSGDEEHTDEELGDLLFTIVNFTRFRGRASASEILNRATDKFIRRFQFVERSLAEQGKSMNTESPEALDVLWNEAKKH